MQVAVERATPDGIRYAGTDIDGRPYGAPRLIPMVLMANFVPEAAAY